MPNRDTEKERQFVIGASKGGYLELLQNSHFIIDPLTACCAAAEAGHLDIVQHFEANVGVKEYFLSAAASGGSLNILQWWKAKNYPWHTQACAYAALNGHLSVLQWLRNNGCHWNEETCAFAASKGHLGQPK